jgi:hypothetical protein
LHARLFTAAIGIQPEESRRQGWSRDRPALGTGARGAIKAGMIALDPVPKPIDWLPQRGSPAAVALDERAGTLD